MAARDDGPAADPVPPARVVDAEVFAVVDRKGNVRAELGADAERGPFLKMYDQHGRQRVELIDSGGATTLSMFDEADTAQVRLRLAGQQARLALGTDVAHGKPATALVSNGQGARGLYLYGKDPDREVVLELSHKRGHLELTDSAMCGRYRANGMHVMSDDGGLGLSLVPGKRAALHMSACPPIAGEEGVEITTSPSSTSLWLKSVGRRSSAYLSARPDMAMFILRPSTEEAVGQWIIRDEQNVASHHFLMSSDNKAESIQITIDQMGPSMTFAAPDGKSLLRLPGQAVK